MLRKHSLIYLLGRVVPAIVSFAGLAAYTRMLDQREYGYYAVTLAAVLLSHTLVYSWLWLALLRFLPAHKDQPQRVLSTVAAGFLVLLGVTAPIGAALAMSFEDPMVRKLVWLSLPMFWLHAWFQINLDMVRSNLAPIKHGLMSMIKATASLAVGVTLVYYGYGVLGIMLGIIVGLALSCLMTLRSAWLKVRWQMVDRRLLRQFLIYGLPLTGTHILVLVIHSSDRFILSYLIGVHAAGEYSVGYDLARQSIYVLMMTINLAAFPMVVRAFEQKGSERARAQLADNVLLLAIVAIPSAAGLILLRENIIGLVIGDSFRDAANELLPWIVLGTLLAGFTAYHFNHGFHLARSTCVLVHRELGAGAFDDNDFLTTFGVGGVGRGFQPRRFIA